MSSEYRFGEAFEAHLRGEKPAPPKPAYRAPLVAAPQETPRMDGIKFDGNSITVNGATYTREKFREVLETNMNLQRSDPKSAFSDRRHPGHQQAVEEMQLAYKWLGGEIDQSAEREIVSAWREALQESEVANPMDELREALADPAYKRALELQRGRIMGAPNKLDDPANRLERAAWNRAEELQRQVKAAEPKRQDRDYAGNPKSPGGKMPDTSRYISTAVRELAKLPPVEQAHRSRELIAAMRNDPAHPFNLPSHPAHKQAVAEMKMLYDGQYYADDGAPIIEK